MTLQSLLANSPSKQGSQTREELEYKRKQAEKLLAANKAAAATLLQQALAQLEGNTPRVSTQAKQLWI